MAHRPLPPLAPVGWTSISDEYRYGLRDLTFNSRPIINNLTLFAQDHVGSAPALARVLTDHLVNVPFVYLLTPSSSSICSNHNYTSSVQRITNYQLYI